ncbi:putative acetyltransferase [Devosia subaequoris]|uniref:Putative acetyltransferase n=1 Tax=Devosia subaequoris TaxID=395930 RepID=A0A7W6IK25_9HYPH|nr:GNAT family N-acetyltransferase [Devosia subaequoris]MBB4050989.1 putative acetyltransferase [Devosia subaequoris]MCP1208343.1 GNAT family N-acetyltransferase [Devosia subaequoris]
MTISIRRAKDDDKSAIANLIQLYLHDMTEFMPFPVGSDGRFEYGFLDRFWRHPYFLMSGEEIAGFALVIEECPLTGRKPCWFMAEFFVLRAYRGRGVGRSTLDLVLKAHPGAWHIAVPHANVAARKFWPQALGGRLVTSRDIAFEGDTWTLTAFQSQ